MTEIQRLKRVFETILAEVQSNPSFAERLQSVFGEAPPRALMTRAGRRRKPGLLDPFLAYADGEQVLREQLKCLTVEQLKDIVAEHGMDTARLAMKWKSADRLVDLITATVRSRSAKGDAFRSGGA